MERPKVKNEVRKRDVTGEIVYLDQRRYDGNGYPGKFQELGETDSELYNTRAQALSVSYLSTGVRPEIMDLYDEYDGRMTDTEASCIALANELLALKEEGSPLTFVDICVDLPAADVLVKVQSIRAGEILADDDEQLAIKSDGEYYPILDMRKRASDLVGVGLRVWGWDYEKYTYTDSDKVNRDYKKDLLCYPSDEKMSQRQLEVMFHYANRTTIKGEASNFIESISLMVNELGHSSFTKSVSSMVYAETGYEGHGHKNLENVKEADIAAFGDLVAAIVGDEPESIGMRQKRELAELVNGVASQLAKDAIRSLVDITWPAQANYILNLRQKDSDKTLIEMLRSENDMQRAVERLQQYVAKWKNDSSE